jgi:hypothetical protein
VRAIALIAALALVGCGTERGMIEAGLASAATRHAVLGAEICGHATGALAAPSVRDVEATGIFEADVPGGHGRTFELGTGHATMAGFDDEGRRCERAVSFAYRAVRGSKRHPEPWRMAQVGPFVGAAAAHARARTPTKPTSVRGDTALHDLTVRPDAPAIDVDVAMTARKPVTVYLRALDDRDLAADALSLGVLLGDRPVFEHVRAGVTQLRVLVAPVDGVYTLRVATTADRPVPARLEIREGAADAMAW